MLRLAITGGLCSGKSTVSQLLRERGCPVVDADSLARELLPGARPELVAHFGAGILDATGGVDRQRLAERVFGSSDAAAADRRQLNRILHPLIMAEAERQMTAWAESGVEIAGVEAALLMEEDLLQGFDRVVLVVSPVEVRLQRALTRGWTREQAQARMAAQWPDAEKRARADVVIDNGGPLADTERQVAAALAAWKSDVERTQL